MDDVIQALEKLTEELLERIDQMSDEDLLTFVDERQQLIDRLSAMPIDAEARQRFGDRVKAILSHDGRIRSKLVDGRQSALDGMAKMDTAKKQKGAYQVEYIPDSYYFDKKK